MSLKGLVKFLLCPSGGQLLSCGLMVLWRALGRGGGEGENEVCVLSMWSPLLFQVLLTSLYWCLTLRIHLCWLLLAGSEEGRWALGREKMPSFIFPVPEEASYCPPQPFRTSSLISSDCLSPERGISCLLLTYFWLAPLGGSERSSWSPVHISLSQNISHNPVERKCEGTLLDSPGEVFFTMKGTYNKLFHFCLWTLLHGCLKWEWPSWSQERSQPRGIREEGRKALEPRWHCWATD